MQPKYPIIWLLMNSITLFLLYHYVINTSSSVVDSIIFAVITSILSLALLYGGEKIRKKWFANNSQ